MAQTGNKSQKTSWTRRIWQKPEEARKLATTDAFNGLGSTANEVSSRGGVMDLLKSSGNTMGLKLLRKMGWKDGQGIGPKVRRKARLGHEDDGDETHLFAPDDTKMISLVRKNDSKGLGFEGQVRLHGVPSNGVPVTTNEDPEEDAFSALNQSIKPKTRTKSQRAAFGVGVLNDNGSDDEDPYVMGPSISYNRVIGEDKKKKKMREPSKAKAATANPLLRTKPIFISKKSTVNNPGFRKCHDGRLPLTGFLLLALH